MSGEFTQDFFTSRRNYDDGNTRIGELDRLWYDSNTNTIRIGDGITPGGIIVSGGGGIGVSGFSGKSGYSGATGLSGFSGAAGTGVNPWIKKTSFYTAVNGDRIIADTSGGSFTIDLPAAPVLGYYVVITDGANFRQNNLIVGRNGSTIEGLADDVALDMQGVTFEFIYSGSTWQVTATTGQSGTSGYSGVGTSGVSGYSGQGESGYSGISLQPWIEITSFYVSSNGDRIIADTSGGSFTIDLPALPITGDYVIITDGADFKTYNLIVGRNGSTIEGLADDVALDMKGVTFEFIYNGTTWQVTGTTGASGTSGFSGIGTSGYSGALDPWKLITSTYYAVNGNRLIGDTSSGSFTVYLPATAVDGDYVQITDGDNFALNNLFVDPNGGTIEGLSDIVALDMKGVTYEFIYSVNTWDVTGTTGASGTSGFSGLGLSGYSGFGGPGDSGYSGISGFSGAGSSLTISNDESTNSTYYPVWATSDTGTTSTIYTASSKLTFNPSTGTLSATEINSLSDIALKHNIQPITNAIETLKNINGVKFNWIENNKSSLGVIAQNIENELPMLVNDSSGMKTVNYNGLISVLIEAFKELSKKIEILEKNNKN